MSPSSRPQAIAQVEVAQAYFNLLRELDPNLAEKTELRQAGVSEARIASLYPISLEAIAATLLDWYHEQGVKSGAYETRWQAHENATAAIYKDLSPALQGQIDSEVAALNIGKQLAKLNDYYNLKFPIRYSFTRRIPSASEPNRALIVLTYAYWGMANRGLLAQRNRNRVDQLMVWIGRNLLPNGTPQLWWGKVVAQVSER